MENVTFIENFQTLFEICFNSDEEREKYMYMYSKDNVHYFKHIITREYIKFKVNMIN